MASSASDIAPVPHTGPAQSPRRDFLQMVAWAGTGIGVAAIAWTMIDSMSPAADVLAAGEPVDVDLSKLAPGQQIVVVWRGKPILVVHRTPEALKTLQSPQQISLLSDPDSTHLQQPPYARNWHRSIKPEYSVLVGICTHLGCIPMYYPDASATTPVTNWLGGYFCPCHGSKYDLAGHVYSGVPAPLNLPVPPYNLTNDKTVRIGQNPQGYTFDLSEIQQL